MFQLILPKTEIAEYEEIVVWAKGALCLRRFFTNSPQQKSWSVSREIVNLTKEDNAGSWEEV